MGRTKQSDNTAVVDAIQLDAAASLFYYAEADKYVCYNDDYSRGIFLYDVDSAWRGVAWTSEYPSNESRLTYLKHQYELVWLRKDAHKSLDLVKTYEFNPLVSQVAGGHYKDRAIQPVEYIIANKLNFNKGNVVKYITRYEDKGGINDLAKVVHYTLLEAYAQYGVEGSTELAVKIKEILGID